MSTPNRVPAGVPTGGEFATGQRAENADLEATAAGVRDDPQVAAARAMMASLTPAQRAAVLSDEDAMPMDSNTAVQLWEDTVGDSGSAPEDREIRDFANAVLATGRPGPVPTIGFTVDEDDIGTRIDEYAQARGHSLSAKNRARLVGNAMERLARFGVSTDDEMYDLFDQGVRDSVKETWDRYFNVPLNFDQRA